MHDCRDCGRPSLRTSASGMSRSASGSVRPTVCRATTDRSGVSGSSRAGATSSRSGWRSPRLIPSRFARKACENVIPQARQTASMTARSTRLVPKWARRGGTPHPPAHADCPWYICRHKSKTVRDGVAARPTSHAVSITWKIRAISSPTDDSGSLVNHLGGRWSAVTPVYVLPSTSTSAWRNRCGRAVSVAMP